MKKLVAKSRRICPPEQVIVVLFSAFAVFFAVQLFANHVLPSLKNFWIELFSAAVAILFTVDALPRIQRALRGPAPAMVDEESFVAAAENSIDDFYIFSGIPDASGQIVDFRFAYINPVAERRLRAQRENLLGRALSEVRPVAVTKGLIARYQEVVRTGIPYDGEVYLDDDRITATWLHVHAVKLGDGIAITSRDITRQKQGHDRASFLAEYGLLTGLANRPMLTTRLNAAIHRMKS
ncbi:PAS domain-containing protein [Edaphobacter flagellatus]|uniref:PAS domain-containing protein n=1 Tax=Edaphobacter flagellatus TaxID=1933044 RepID=UPI0021B16CC3|nr:PAS domain-containing protein [Edaphobacter flagellatus]